MTKQSILEQIEIGSRVAEDEQKKLKQYFIQTNTFKDLDRDIVDIIYGLKGTGKSAIYLHLIENISLYKARKIFMVQAENIRGDSAFKSVVEEPPTDETSFRNIWKLYFLVLIYENYKKYFVFNPSFRKVGNILRESGLLSGNKTLIEYFSDTYKYIKKSRINGIEGNINIDTSSGIINGLGGKISFDNREEFARPGNYNISSLYTMIYSELEKKGFTIWILLDRLDTVFEENELLEENAIRGLFKAYLDISAFRNIKLKIFLRTDIWNKITKKGFREASHITRFTNINWNEENILNLIVRRFVENQSILDYYDVKKEDVLHDYTKQKNLFYKIFPDRVEKGKMETIRWIITHTWDSTNTITPREIIHFILELRKLQLDNFSIGKDQTESLQLFDRSIFKDALKDVSRVRMEQTVFAEYSRMKQFVIKLMDKKATNTYEKLVEYLGEKNTRSREIIDELVEIGILRKIKFQETQYYEVPFIYRPYLNSIQGRSGDSDNY